MSAGELLRGALRVLEAVLMAKDPAIDILKRARELVRDLKQAAGAGAVPNAAEVRATLKKFEGEIAKRGRDRRARAAERHRK